MQFSTNRKHGTPVTANVSREADKVFMAELKRTDRDRYNRLWASMEREAYRTLPKAA